VKGEWGMNTENKMKKIVIIAGVVIIFIFSMRFICSSVSDTPPVQHITPGKYATNSICHSMERENKMKKIVIIAGVVIIFLLAAPYLYKVLLYGVGWVIWGFMAYFIGGVPLSDILSHKQKNILPLQDHPAPVLQNFRIHISLLPLFFL